MADPREIIMNSFSKFHTFWGAGKNFLEGLERGQPRMLYRLQRSQVPFPGPVSGAT